MAFNVNTFKTNLTGENSNEIARQSHFEMWVSLPEKILLSEVTKKATGQTLRFKINAAEFPGRSIITSDYKQTGYGLTSKIGYGAVYHDVNISMVCDKELNEKKLFTSWQNIIVGNHNRQQNIRKHQSIGYYQDYTCPIIIVQYDQEGNQTYGIVLNEAYPIIINSLPLNWGSEELHTLNVQIAYKYFTDLNEEALGNGAVGGGARSGLSISGFPSVDNILNNNGLPGLSEITGNSFFNTNSFTIR